MNEIILIVISAGASIFFLKQGLSGLFKKETLTLGTFINVGKVKGKWAQVLGVVYTLIGLFFGWVAAGMLLS